MNTFQFDDDEGSGNRFLVGMIWGVAIGAVAGLFLAPRRGSELRGQVADSVNRASRRAADTYNRASETMNDLAGKAADMTKNLSDRASVLTAKLNRTMSERTYPPIS
jgi:gas vesicle protein